MAEQPADRTADRPSGAGEPRRLAEISAAAKQPSLQPFSTAIKNATIRQLTAILQPPLASGGILAANRHLPLPQLRQIGQVDIATLLEDPVVGQKICDTSIRTMVRSGTPAWELCLGPC